MPVKGGTYRPGDVIDLHTIGAQMQAQAEAAGNTLPIDLSAIEEIERPSASEVSALGRRDWPTTKMLEYVGRLTAEDDPNFKQPWDELEPKYQPYRDLFEDAHSYQQWYTATTIADQAMKDAEMFQNMTGADYARYIGWQFIDPVTVALTIATAGYATLGKGLTIAQAAGRTAALGAGEAATIELLLQATDPTRELDDSVVSTMAGGAFGAIIGAGGQGLVKYFGRNDKLKKEIFNVFKDELDLQRANNALPQGVTPTYTAADEQVLTNPFRYLLDNPLMRNAQIRLHYSDSPILSRLADKISANNTLKKGDYNGTRYNGPTLNETIKQTQRRSFRILTDLSYDAQRELRKKGIKLSLDDISFRATRAARRGGTGDKYDEINRIGMQFREDLNDWAERGIRMKVLTKEVVDAMDNYVPRMYDTQRILKHWDQWEIKIKAHFRANRPDLTEDDLNAIPRDVFDTINKTQTHEATPHRFTKNEESGKWEAVWGGNKPKSGQLKARELDLSDADLEDFLINDIRVLSNRYIMGAGADIMMREQFGADNVMSLNGVAVPKADFEAGMKQLTDKAAELRRAGKTRQANKLEKQIKRIPSSLEHYMRQVMHRPIPPKSEALKDLSDSIIGGKSLRGYSASAQLGEVIESAFPDASNNILQHGLMNVLSALPTFFRALPQVFKRAGGKGYVQQHWRDMDVALDNILSSHVIALADIEDAHLYGVQRGFFHGSEVARKAFRFFLADRWNTGAKLLAATVAERAILRNAKKMANGTLGKHVAAKMRRIGMTDDIARRIADNHSKAGARAGLANVEQWDTTTYGDLKRMVFRESEFQVVAPDAGEIPDVMDNEVGRLIMQFKTFIVSHTMKQLMPAGQRLMMGDMRVMAGITAMTTLGIMSQFVKEVTRNQFDVEKVVNEWQNKNLQDYIAIGLDRGAVLSYLPGLLGTLNNHLNQKLGESVGMTPRATAWRPRFGTEDFIPGAGYLGILGTGLFQGVTGALPEEYGGDTYTAKDLNKVRRSIPLQNTFYLAWLFDMGEDYVAETFNLPEQASGKRRSVSL